MSIDRCKGCGGWTVTGRACRTCEIIMADQMLLAFHERSARIQWQQDTVEGRQDYLAKLR